MSLFSKTRIGVSIQDNVLLITQVSLDSYRKTQEIRAIGSATIPKGIIKEGHIVDTVAFKELIEKTMTEAFPKPIKNVELVFEVPESNTFYALLKLPKNIPKDQQMEAVLIEAEKVLPFSIDQMSWDSRIIGHNGNTNDVLFAASPHELVQEYYDVFQKCRLQPLGFSTRLENLLKCITKDKAKPTILIDLQKEYTTVLFFIGQRLLATHQISMGEHDLMQVIVDHFDLNPKRIETELKDLSLVEINLATVHTMKTFEQELSALINEFQELAEGYRKSVRNIGQEEPKKEKDTEPSKAKEPDTKESKHDSEDSEKTSKKAKTAQELIEEYPDDPLKYRFVFTGHHVLGNAIKEFFDQNKNIRLMPLESDLRKLLTVQPADPSIYKKFFLNTANKNHSAGKKNNKKTKEKAALKLPLHSDKPSKEQLQKMLPGTIGSAMADFSLTDKDQRPLNLLPRLVRAIALWKKTSGWFYFMATIMLIFSVGWLMAFGFNWGQTLAQLRTAQSNFIIVERQLSVKKPLTLEDKVQTANAELQKIRSLKNNNVSYSDIVNDVRNIIPEPVTVAALQYGLLSDTALFELKASAPTREMVIDTYKLIQLLPFVKEVIFPASNFNEKTDEIDFSLQFRIRQVPNAIPPSITSESP